MSYSWKSITSAYTYEYGGKPYAPSSCIVTNKPHYLKPQWFHCMPDSTIMLENEDDNGFSDTNLALVNANTAWGAMPMIKGDYCGPKDRAIITWMESIDTEAKRINQVNQITQLIIKHDFVGIEIDYEPTSIDALRSDGKTKITMQDIENKYIFLKLLSSAVHSLAPKVLKNGKMLTRKVSVAIGANTESTSTNGYQMVNYTRLAETNVDYIMIMNYDWWYSEDIYDDKSLGNRSTSPIREFEETIQYAIKTIPVDKIVIGLPDYGYSGEYGKDIQESRILRLENASKLPNYSKGTIVQQMTSYKNNSYRTGSELWFENGNNMAHIPTSKTMNIKRDICEKYGIKQVSVWAFAGSTNYPTPWFSGKSEPLT
jgi:spore germination protein YaaH